ncbi:MAG: sigma-70 family RNA polymerase sigma factor [Clostridia bacterium]|nr:sigma-70 family RNA polymerase sigma factor [Clostridia bacterium]
MADKNNMIIEDKELFDIVSDVQSGNDESFSVLKRKYAPLISRSVRSFEGETADVEEYRREAESALLKAALKYDLSRTEVSFGLFAKICIKNALISLLRKEMSRKRRLERHVSRRVAKKKRSYFVAPTESSSSAETEKIVSSISEILSPYEREVFREYMSDKTAEEIALALGRSKKSVNNALYRIKEKVKNIDDTDK